MKSVYERIYDPETGFAAVYRSAQRFVDSGPLWDMLVHVACNQRLLDCIVFANALGIPPVKAFAHIYQIVENPAEDFEFPEQTRQWMGAFWAFIFKSILGYDGDRQKERVSVGMLGIRTATLYPGSSKDGLNIPELVRTSSDDEE